MFLLCIYASSPAENFSPIANPNICLSQLLSSRPPLSSPTIVNLHLFHKMSSTASSTATTSSVVGEYAKSGRSSCKHCGNAIALGSLRLGLASRDSRGFDVTRWHHFSCFPMKSAAGIADVERIKGFSSLKNCDQEALKKLGVAVSSNNETSLEDSKDPNLEKDESEKISVVRKAGEFEIIETKETSFKKPKLLEPDNQISIILSISDVKVKYKDATLSPRWKAFRTIIFREKDDGLHDSSKIAAFDFDGCLANTSVKKIGPNAWYLLYPSVPEKLQALYNDGYKLVIFTNESNIERWKNKRQQAIDSKIGRLDNFIKCVKVPMQIFVACGLGKSNGETDDPFRKPNTGMWTIMKEHFNAGIPIDMDQSFYVGDAAGRAHDHSDADIRFAKAIGLKFYVPEEYFIQ